jgi:hypothetical protein
MLCFTEHWLKEDQLELTNICGRDCDINADYIEMILFR